MQRPCEFWPMQALCSSPGCSICECQEQDVSHSVFLLNTKPSSFFIVYFVFVLSTEDIDRYRKDGKADPMLISPCPCSLIGQNMTTTGLYKIQERVSINTPIHQNLSISICYQFIVNVFQLFDIPNFRTSTVYFLLSSIFVVFQFFLDMDIFIFCQLIF